MSSDTRKYWVLGILTAVIIGFCLMSTYLMQQLANRVVAHRARRLTPAATTSPAVPAAVTEGSELLGTQPAEWVASDWINSEPLTLASLRGKVVLVRWWTSPGCPYCEATAPTLNDFWERYRDKGLVVIGMYHHKADVPLTREHVTAQAGKFGFKFPVAIDADWKTLHRWWLDTAPRRGRFLSERQFTSVTFLLDRTGAVRHIHPGGIIQKGDPGHEALAHAIEDLLAGPASGG
jgi:thiol-disulfide isomerase/thioredoxin